MEEGGQKSAKNNMSMWKSKLLRSLFSSSQNDPTLADKIYDKLMDHSVAAMEEILGEMGAHRIRDLCRHFDDTYIKPIVLNQKKVGEPQFMQVGLSKTVTLKTWLSFRAILTEFFSPFRLWKLWITRRRRISSNNIQNYLQVNLFY